MIHLVTAADYGTYRRELDDMHRLRYRVFKERLGWDVAVVAGRERDQFDDLEPTYLLAIDELGTVVGSWRFLSTTGPYMLRDVFSQLLDGRPAPSDIGVWEGSRFAVERSALRGGSLGSVGQVASELLCAVVETCMATGVRELITVYDAPMARLLHRMGCPPIWQGRPHRVGRGLAMAGHFAMTAEVPDAIRNAAARAIARTRAPARRSGHRLIPRGTDQGARHVRPQTQLPRRLAGLRGGPSQLASPTALPGGGGA